MTFDKGRVGVLIVILSLIASVGLGVITNIETKTVQKDVTSYVADITGAFDSEKQQAYTDYNPAKNYNGYTGMNTSYYAIDFVPSANPNNFPITYYSRNITNTYDPDALMVELGLTSEISSGSYDPYTTTDRQYVGTDESYRPIYYSIVGPTVESVSEILLSEVIDEIVESDPDNTNLSQLKITLPINNVYQFAISYTSMGVTLNSGGCPDNYVSIWPTNKAYTDLHKFMAGDYGKGTNYLRDYTLTYTPSTGTCTLYLNGTQWYAGALSSYTLSWGKGYSTPPHIGDPAPPTPNRPYYDTPDGVAYAPQINNSIIIEKTYSKETEYIDTRYGVSPKASIYVNEGTPVEDILPELSDYSEWDLTIGYDESGTTVQVTSDSQTVYEYSASPSPILNVMGYGDSYGFYAKPTSNRMELVTSTNMISEPASTLLIKKENGQYSLSKVYNNVTTLISSNIDIDQLFISKDDGERIIQKSDGGAFEIGYDDLSDIYGIGFKADEPSNVTTWGEGKYHLIVGTGSSSTVVTNDWTVASTDSVDCSILTSLTAVIGSTILSTAEYICAPQVAGQNNAISWNNGYKIGVTDIAFSVWNPLATDVFTSTGGTYITTGILNYENEEPDVLTVTREGQNMYISLNGDTPVNIGAWNQIQVTLDNIAGVIHIHPIQAWNNFNNYTVSPTSIDINGLKKTDLKDITWKGINSLRFSVTNTQVFFNTYGVVMVDPEIEVGTLWPNYQKYMVRISDVASIGTSIEIGQHSYDITNNTITIPQTHNSVTLDVTDLELYYTQIENGWEVNVVSGNASAEIDVEDTTLKFNGLWYFKAGFYSVETKDTTERTWNPITYNWFESNLFFWMAGIILVFSVIAYKTGYLDGLSIVILIGTEVILILIGGT